MKKVYTLAALVGLVCALLVFFVIRRQKQENADAIAEANEIANAKAASVTEIVVAAQDIPKGTLLSADMLTTIEMDREILVTVDAVTSVDAAVGRQTVRNFIAREAITNDGLRNTAGGRRELSYSVPEGLYAVQVRTDRDSSVAGHIEEGDIVDVAVRRDSSGADARKGTETPEWDIVAEKVKVIRLGDRIWDGEGIYDYVIIAADRETVMTVLSFTSDGDAKLILNSGNTEAG